MCVLEAPSAHHQGCQCPGPYKFEDTQSCTLRPCFSTSDEVPVNRDLLLDWLSVSGKVTYFVLNQEQAERRLELKGDPAKSFLHSVKERYFLSLVTP